MNRDTHPVVHLGFELDSGLDDVHRGERTVCDGAPESTGERVPASTSTPLSRQTPSGP